MNLQTTWILSQPMVLKRVYVSRLTKEPPTVLVTCSLIVLAAYHDVLIAHRVIYFFSNGSWHQVPVLVRCALCRPLHHHASAFLICIAAQLAHLRVAWTHDMPSAPLCLV